FRNVNRHLISARAGDPELPVAGVLRVPYAPVLSREYGWVFTRISDPDPDRLKSSRAAHVAEPIEVAEIHPVDHLRVRGRELMELERVMLDVVELKRWPWALG